MEQQIPKPVVRWLSIGCIMVFMMVVIGGITRLTGSGLSMTEWNLIMGSVPPMNEAEWNETFEQYKQFPQFQKINQDMDLGGFKMIFFWEFFHRFWGRLIGIVFFIPFIIFLVKYNLPKPMIRNLIIAMLLGAFQAALGWVMVKSGLVDMPWVSPYRLTAHLLTALFLYCFLLWLTFSSAWPKLGAHLVSLRKLGIWITAIVSLQIAIGGFMSGTHAALNFPTWPDMNGQWIPENLWILEPWVINFFENVTTIQFFHRGTAYLASGLIFYFWWQSLKQKGAIAAGGHFMFVALLVQVSLGILTLLNSKVEIPVSLGVLHQAVAVILLTSCIWMNFLLRKRNEGLVVEE